MPSTPQALAAVERYPTLRQTAPALQMQQHRIAERMRRFVPRAELIAEFDTLLGEVGSGLLLVEGPHGAGATSLLCQLAAQRPYPLWLPSDDAGAGLAALCAQIIALHDLPVPLVPPAADRDPLILEQLLAEAASRRSPTNPLVVLIDAPADEHTAIPAPFPAHVPDGVVLVYACQPGYTPAIEPAARLRLPTSGPVLIRSLVDVAQAYGLPKTAAAAIAAHSGRSFLYVTLACGLLRTGMLRRRALPEGLLALHEAWWQGLDDHGRRLACVLAAAVEPLPVSLASEVSHMPESHVADLLTQWGPLVEHDSAAVSLYHPATRAFLAARHSEMVTSAHMLFVELAYQQFGPQFEQHVAGNMYLARQLARHVAFSPQPERETAAPLLVGRPWVLAQERRTGGLSQPASDAAWAARTAAEAQQLDQLVCAVVTGGTLATLGRQLAPDVAAEALITALDRGEPRDAALRRVRATLDQLADGREKALVLRRLGEVCFERGIKAQAMRMLAEALDLEVPGLPRSWRDEREEAQVALARAAIVANAPDRALGITVRIGHPERRGMIETEVVRHLIAGGNLTRAEEVAHAIGHEHTHEWAMAEIAAGHARAGNSRRFREVLGTLKTATAIAWARSELACDAARHGDTTAVEQVAVIANERLRDQAFGLVAQALVEGNQPASALIAARLIADREVRARALIALAQLRVSNASAALAHAGEDVRTLGDDERTPLTVLLATAYATTGNLSGALHTVGLLDEGEERDRGHSRVAAALARVNELDTAARIAAAIPDDDERGWTQRELVAAYAAAGRFDTAVALVTAIVDDEQRARAQADLCIARARAGRLAGALTGIEQIAFPTERARALSAIAEPMVRRGFTARAEAARETIADTAARSRYTLALANALANAGMIDTADQIARRADRPLDVSRALVNCARACTTYAPKRAHGFLAEAAQRSAALSRSDTVTVLIAAADVLVALGGAELLLTVAHALDEVDSWWG